MLYYAVVFLVVGLTAGVLNLAGVAANAIQISWTLFLMGIVLLAIHMVRGGSVLSVGAVSRFSRRRLSDDL